MNAANGDVSIAAGSSALKMAANAPARVRPSEADLGLVADIGGTNARFGLVSQAGDRISLSSVESFFCADYPTAEAAAAAYLARHGDVRPSSAVLAVAGPIVDGEIALTNTDWRIAEAAFRDTIGLKSATLINDYAALAFGLPLLGDDDLIALGGPKEGQEEGTVAVLGAGTGFGVAGLVRNHGAEAVMTTEGGHAAFAPYDELEVEVWRILKARFGRVSIERVLSGPGLLSLYEALCRIGGEDPTCNEPAEVSRAIGRGDPTAVRTAELFCAIMGSVAGDFALAYGAEGGVYLAGGVSRHLAPHLQKGGFRARFEDKGRFGVYTGRIPTYLIDNTHTAALTGAARKLQKAAG